MKLTRKKRAEQTNISEKQVLPTQSESSSATNEFTPVSEATVELRDAITARGRYINDTLDLIFKTLKKLIRENNTLKKRVDELEKKERQNGI